MEVDERRPDYPLQLLFLPKRGIHGVSGHLHRPNRSLEHTITPSASITSPISAYITYYKNHLYNKNKIAKWPSEGR